MNLNETELLKLQRLVCGEIKIPVRLLKSRTRKREVVKARQIYQYLLVEIFKYSLNDAGEEAGGYDHATAFHSIKTVRNLSETDKIYAQNVNAIIDQAKEYKKEFEDNYVLQRKPKLMDIIDRATSLIEEMKQALINEQVQA
jgi:hypothetical protein